MQSHKALSIMRMIQISIVPMRTFTLFTTLIVILRTQLHGLFKMAVNALFPTRWIPSVNHTSCEESIVFPSTNQKN